MQNSANLSIEETKVIRARQTRRNRIALALLGVIVSGMIILSFWHVGKEVRASQQSAALPVQDVSTLA